MRGRRRKSDSAEDGPARLVPAGALRAVTAEEPDGAGGRCPSTTPGACAGRPGRGGPCEAQSHAIAFSTGRRRETGDRCAPARLRASPARAARDRDAFDVRARHRAGARPRAGVVPRHAGTSPGVRRQRRAGRRPSASATRKRSRRGPSGRLSAAAALAPVYPDRLLDRQHLIENHRVTGAPGRSTPAGGNRTPSVPGDMRRLGRLSSAAREAREPADGSGRLGAVTAIGTSKRALRNSSRRTRTSASWRTCSATGGRRVAPPRVAARREATYAPSMMRSSGSPIGPRVNCRPWPTSSRSRDRASQLRRSGSSVSGPSSADAHAVRNGIPLAISRAVATISRVLGPRRGRGRRAAAADGSASPGRSPSGRSTCPSWLTR